MVGGNLDERPIFKSFADAGTKNATMTSFNAFSVIVEARCLALARFHC